MFPENHKMTKTATVILISVIMVMLSFTPVEAQNSESSLTQPPQAITTGIEQLIKLQHDDGAWPYEGVYRVNRKIPVGYRIGGTAISSTALLYGSFESTNQQLKKDSEDAIRRGVKLILKELDDPLMKPSTVNRYDVRVWGHIYALDLFCRLKSSGRFKDLEPEFSPWIEKLTQILLEEEIESGGWNYANRRSHAGFVTAPAVEALLWAKQLGQSVPEEVLQRTRDALRESRNQTGAFAYSGPDRDSRPAQMPGSIARSAACETALSLLGLQRAEETETSINAFYEYWEELEKRRKKTGTHKPPYGVAPYYFYYGHRYVAQAIQRLPVEKQAAHLEKFAAILMRTRDEDGTWNDRVFEQSKAYGTSMSVLALLGDRVLLPERIPFDDN
jgi:hypothetical protein